MKKTICALLSVVLLLGLFACAKPAEEIVPAGTCTLTVDCHILSQKADTLSDAVASVLPEDGIMLQAKDVAFADGETAQELLLRIAKEEKLAVECANSAYGAYVEGIGGLYAGDGGDLSGWLYTVNGAMMSVAASEYVLKDGDAVAFLYSCDMGNDIGYTH